MAKLETTVTTTETPDPPPLTPQQQAAKLGYYAYSRYIPARFMGGGQIDLLGESFDGRFYVTSQTATRKKESRPTVNESVSRIYVSDRIEMKRYGSEHAAIHLLREAERMRIEAERKRLKAEERQQRLPPNSSA